MFKRVGVCQLQYGEFTGRPYRLAYYAKGSEAFYVPQAMADDGSFDDIGGEYDTREEANKAIDRFELASHQAMMEIRFNVQ